MNKKGFIIFLVLFINITYSFSDPLIYGYDAKIKSMGGAYTAVSNNSVASVYNPAGLVFFDNLREKIIMGLSLTYETTPYINFSGKNSADNANLSTGSLFFMSKWLGMAISYIQYPKINYYKSPSYNPGLISAAELNYKGIGAGVALKLLNFKYFQLSLGYGVKIIEDKNLGGINYQKFGAKLRFINFEKISLDLGVSWTPSEKRDDRIDEKVDAETGNTYLFPVFPKENRIGIALNYGGRNFSYQTVIDYIQRDYDEELIFPNKFFLENTEGIAFGAELGFKYIQIRFGGYKYDSIFNQKAENFIFNKYRGLNMETKGYTFGLGLSWKIFQVDLAADKRLEYIYYKDIDKSYGTKSNDIYYSISITLLNY